MSEFLKRKLPEQEGDILDTTGNKVGKHQGARFYTIGQRHQLFLPFKAYVVATDVNNNTITVSENKNDEKLLSDTVIVKDRYGEEIKGQCLVKIRYRSEPIEARLIHQDLNAKTLTFHIPESR